MSFVCDHCGYTYSDDKINHFDGQGLCDECYEEETVICEHCGDRIWSEGAADCGRTLCRYCYDDCYTHCEHCGRAINNDDAYYFDDDDEYPYCHDCYHERKNYEYFHDYNYKPDPIFYGNGNKFFGVELEIDGGGDDDSNAKKLRKLQTRKIAAEFISSMTAALATAWKLSHTL